MRRHPHPKLKSASFFLYNPFVVEIWPLQRFTVAKKAHRLSEHHSMHHVPMPARTAAAHWLDPLSLTPRNCACLTDVFNAFVLVHSAQIDAPCCLKSGGASCLGHSQHQSLGLVRSLPLSSWTLSPRRSPPPQLTLPLAPSEHTRRPPGCLLNPSLSAHGHRGRLAPSMQRGLV